MIEADYPGQISRRHGGLIEYLEPLQWRAWAGMAKTLMLFAIPRSIVTTLKAEWRSRNPSGERVGRVPNLPRATAEIAKPQR